MSDETVIIDLKDLIPTSNEEWRLAALQLGDNLRRETLAPDEIADLIDTFSRSEVVPGSWAAGFKEALMHVLSAVRQEDLEHRARNL